jgi:CBS domain-containing protein
MCRKDVVTVGPGTMVTDVTKLMEEKNIGSVVIQNVIVSGERGKFGIVTDRVALLGKEMADVADIIDNEGPLL